MLDLSTLITRLLSVSSCHNMLIDTFERFSTLAIENLTAPAFPVRGVNCTRKSDRFTANFANRNLEFVFSSPQGQDGNLIGLVQCYLVPQNHYQGRALIGLFEFQPNGDTNMHCPQYGNVLNLKTNQHTMQIVGNFIYESLAHTLPDA